MGRPETTAQIRSLNMLAEITYDLHGVSVPFT